MTPPTDSPRRLGLLPAAALLLQACSTTGLGMPQEPGAETANDDADRSVEVVTDESTEAASDASYGHLPIGTRDAGLCFGNSKRWTGLRLNIRDHGVEEVTGVNLTFWSPGSPAIERFTGLAIGVTPAAAQATGVSLGLLATVADESMTGAQVAGLATVSEGTLTGLSAAGLSVVAKGEMTGLSVAGLAVVSEADMTGLNVAGLAVVSEGRQRGVNIAGLALVSEGSKVGLNLAGLATVSQIDLSGVSAAGLVTVAEEDLSGINVSGLATVFGHELQGIAIAGLVVGDSGSRSLNLAPNSPPNSEYDTSASGVMLAGYRVQANRIDGIAAALLMTRSHDMAGLAIGAYNGVSGRQSGLSVGLYNHATELRGIQIGLLNHVADNPKWLRWLPIVNARF